MKHITDFERVFNNSVPLVFGRGGGKSAGKNDENTLASKTTARMIEVISEGPIVGLIDGKKSVYLDKTPIMSETDYENFRNVILEEHKGYPDETAFVGHPAIEATTTVETQVTVKNGPVGRTINDPNVNAVRVIIKHPALVEQSDKGELKRTSVKYAIDYRTYNGQWQEAVLYEEKKQKTLSAFQRAHRIDLPSTGSPWDIRVRRITADSEKDNVQNDVYFDSFVTLIEGKFIYPHTAAIAMEVNAEDLGSSLPSRFYKVRGRIISVPSNYYPDERKYVGVWDGTFKQEWTNNPAWVFYDLITHDRYGLGEYITPSIADKWSLYTIAQYCDQLVPSGFRDVNGNDVMEPRFTFNGVINSREEAFYVLQSITKAWRGMAYWAIGQVFATGDMPSDPVKLVSSANVINGEFEYQSTALKARHSAILVKWNNPDNFYEPEVEAVVDSRLVHEYNWREKSLTLEGCTSRGLAHRYGKWIIDSEQHETETISYAASWDHADVRPGDIIAVSDPHKAKIRAAGRFVDVSGTRAELDAPFDATEGAGYTLMATAPSGKIESRAISYFEAPNVAILKTAFNEQIAPNAMWTITGTDITPRTYRIITVSEEEENIFRVTALEHDPQKYDRVEKGIVFEPLPYKRDDNEVSPPTNLYCREVGYISNGTSIHNLNLSWTPPQNTLTRGYYVVADTPEGTRLTLGYTDETAIDLINSTGGQYTFYVQTVNFAGLLSPPATLDFWAAGAEGFARPVVKNLQLVENPNSTEFKSRDLAVQWENRWPSSNDPTAESGTATELYSPYYLNNRVRLYRGDDNTLLREVYVTDSRFTYSFQANENDNIAKGRAGATRSIRVEVVCNDTIGRTSNAASVTFRNPPPEALSPVPYVWANEIWLSYTRPKDDDFVGALMWIEEAPGYKPEQVAPKYDGTNNPQIFKLDYESAYFVRIAGYDTFGKSELNYSSEIPVTTLTDGADVDPPKTPTGLKVTSALVNGRARMTVTWNANSEADMADYDLQIAEGAGSFVSFLITGTSWEGDVLPGVTYKVRIRARDRNANASPTTETITHVAVKDTTPPAPVTDPKVAAGLNSIWLNWINPTDDDLDHIEIWEHTANDLSKATMVGVTAGTSFSRSGLAYDTTRYYWLIAVDTSGNKAAASSAVSGTTAQLPDVKRVTTVGLTLKPNTPSLNKVSWGAFTVSTAVPGADPLTEAVAAGSATYTTADVYLYYVEGTGELRSTTSVATMFKQYGHPIAVYRGGKDAELATGKAMVNGNDIIAGTIGAQQLIADQAIITGTAQIGKAVIETAHIKEIDAQVIKSGSVLSDTIGIGTDAETLKSLAEKANDPASQVNKGSTIIQPGKIQIKGSTSLSSWINGGDSTEINGGAIAAGTIRAVSMQIGQRGITIDGITFEHNSPSANRVSWTAGTISYVADNGSNKTVAISASNAAWTAGTLWLYWVKDATTISVTTDFNVANKNNTVVLASYKGTVFLFAAYGRTIVDGGQLKTDSIETRHLKAGAVTAQAISVTSLGAISANLGAVDIDLARVRYGQLDAAYIKDLTVDSIKIKNGAVTAQAVSAYADEVELTGNPGTWYDMISVGVSNTVQFPIIVGGVMTVVHKSGAPAQYRLLRNGVVLDTWDAVTTLTNTTHIPHPIHFIDDTAPVGWITYTLQLNRLMPNTAVRTGYRRLTAMVFKK
ncbi:putative phage tail protein [Ochrobactrum sp. P20RRXII]|nr:phage tail protein [Ochrobactrum sp. P20RRXII]NIH77435.1 putative phage tail protein [Ochrobactrum sp. P20RRXII]